MAGQVQPVMATETTEAVRTPLLVALQDQVDDLTAARQALRALVSIPMYPPMHPTLPANALVLARHESARHGELPGGGAGSDSDDVALCEWAWERAEWWRAAWTTRWGTAFPELDVTAPRFAPPTKRCGQEDVQRKRSHRARLRRRTAGEVLAEDKDEMSSEEDGSDGNADNESYAGDDDGEGAADSDESEEYIERGPPPCVPAKRRRSPRKRRNML